MLPWIWRMAPGEVEMRAVVTRALAGAAVVLLGSAAAHAGAQARLRGRVIDSAGNPIPDAVVVITSDELEGFRKEVEVKQSGTFSTVILDATRTYVFRVEADGYLPHEEPFKVPANSTDNDFEFVLKSVEEARAEGAPELAAQPGWAQIAEARKLLEEGRRAEARAALERGAAAAPDLLTVHLMLADLCFELGDQEAALASAERCLALDDESTACLALAANAAAGLGRHDVHQEYLARYQALNPDDPAALFNQAAKFLNEMDDESARPLLERCLSADPEFPKCLYELGMLLLRSGDLEGARAHLERYLAAAPDGSEAATARETLKYL